MHVYFLSKEYFQDQYGLQLCSFLRKKYSISLWTIQHIPCGLVKQPGHFQFGWWMEHVLMICLLYLKKSLTFFVMLSHQFLVECSLNSPSHTSHTTTTQSLSAVLVIGINVNINPITARMRGPSNYFTQMVVSGIFHIDTKFRWSFLCELLIDAHENVYSSYNYYCDLYITPINAQKEQFQHV